MSAILLDGKALAAKTEIHLAERVERIKQHTNGIKPILATILVGDDPASGALGHRRGRWLPLVHPGHPLGSDA